MVIDASAAAAWSLPSQQTTSAIALLQDDDGALVAPWYFGVEFRNVMLRAERRGLITRDAGEAAIADTMQIVALAPPPSSASLDEIQRLARREGMSHYDAHYLDLALGRSLPLASRDEALLKACARLGVETRDLRD